MYDMERAKDERVRASLLRPRGCATISPMHRFARGLAFLFLAACGESPAPPPPPPPSGPYNAKPPAPAPEVRAPEPAKKKEPVDKKARSKSPELFKKYMAIMESNGELIQSIEEDVEQKKGEAVIKPKVTKLVKNAEAARALHYRKDDDDDKALDADFDLFLFKMESLSKATWDADSGKDLFEKLQGRCLVCHDKFQ